MRFGKNNVLCNISIYMNFRGVWWGCTWSTILFLFIIKKMEKVQEHDLNLNQILHHFDLNIFFLGLIIIFLWKWGPRSPFSLRSEYSSSNWFHSSTPNSMHLFNTNMYLIHFHSKNIIKMHFPKSKVFKVSKLLQTFIIHRNAVK